MKAVIPDHRKDRFGGSFYPILYRTDLSEEFSF